MEASAIKQIACFFWLGGAGICMIVDGGANFSEAGGKNISRKLK